MTGTENGVRSVALEREDDASACAPTAERGEKKDRKPVSSVLIRGAEEREGLAGAVRLTKTLLGALSDKPNPKGPRELLDRLLLVEELYL